MKIVKLSDHIAVSEQITAADTAAIAAAGYRVLVNNRPDGEEADQPANAELATAAAAAGLEYHHLPITAANFPGPQVELMGRLLDDASRPVLAFCRTGTRCTNLWVATREGDAREQARQEAQRLGYDLSMSNRVA